MKLRKARPDDSSELLAQQEQCPQGENLIISVVNTPDFFARAKAYESSKVLVAIDEDRIIGSATVAIRNASANGKLGRIAYGFQAFVLPGYRRKGVFNLLEREIEKC
jgi:hypothetical protein